ncbi:YcaO-like family protein [Burkholderia sp. 22PA0106]|uniref:YcaO-like family protein n=1 Tax=Burkholderia sp. 22PA0106 TaxID=3237371 RepID=UPI0039C18FD5
MQLHNRLLRPELVAQYPFLSLVAPFGGVVRGVYSLPQTELHVPRFHAVLSHIGNLSMAYSHIAEQAGNDLQRIDIGGCGADESLDIAMIRSVAEAAERYATCVYDKRDVTVASFAEMDERGIPAERIPRCSDQEYAHPKCRLRRIDPQAPLRWIPGYSLLHRRTTYVPLIMTHLYARPWAGESFWLPISTGVAAHLDFARAAVAAICEVVERDAISLLWLLRMQAPRVHLDEPTPAAHAEKIRRLDASLLDHRVFDVTLDTGIPTLYSLQLRDGAPHAAQFVNCSTSFDTWGSYSKLIRESAMGRTILEHRLPVPEDLHDFVELEQGAIHMARIEHRAAFDFLLAPHEADAPAPEPSAPRHVGISRIGRGLPTEPASQLKYIVERFAALGMDIVLVDMTTDELRDAGLHVVRAVIPDLMPMSACYGSRYLGHARLLRMQRELETRTGRAHPINPYPQPFA